MNLAAWSVTLVVLMSAVAAVGQDTKQIAAVRAAVASTNKKAAGYSKTTRDVSGLSTEGAEAVYFHKGKELKKITARIYGETFNASSEFYFDGGKPLFYFFKLRRYDTQIGLSKPVKVVKVEEERYYFSAGTVVKVMAGKKVVRESDERYAAMRDEILKLADDLQKAYNEH